MRVDVTHKSQSLVAGPDGLVLNGAAFPFAGIEHVAWAVEVSGVNGAYLGSSYYVAVASATDRRFFQMDGGGARDSRVEECRGWFVPVVAALQREVVPRLAADSLAALRRGERLRYGGATGWVASERGVRSRPVGRTTPWEQIAGLTDAGANVRLRVVDPAGRETHRLLLARRAWDVPVLEELIDVVRTGGLPPR